MKKAGCKRVYIGVESGSVSILEAMSKKIDLDAALDNIKLLHKHEIETSGFFMVGHPLETEDDFNQSMNFAIKADFSYAMAFEFVCYPGTPIYKKYEEKIEFSLFPYKNKFRDDKISSTAKMRVKKFYRMFYFRPKLIVKSIMTLYRNPKELMLNFQKTLSYQISRKNKKSVRDDFI
jgi:anaerobic magnesium-protoporphyrin IX monomethyl ester cyclase